MNVRTVFIPLFLPAPLCLLVVLLHNFAPAWHRCKRGLLAMCLMLAAYPVTLRVGFDLHVAGLWLPAPAHAHPQVREYLEGALVFVAVSLILALILMVRRLSAAALLPVTLALGYQLLVPSIAEALPEAADLDFPRRLGDVAVMWSVLHTVLLAITLRFVFGPSARAARRSI